MRFIVILNMITPLMGEGLNEGTYYYLVKLTNVNGGVETYQGWIFIKR